MGRRLLGHPLALKIFHNLFSSPDNADFTMRFITKGVERDGKTYMQIDKSKMTFDTTRLYMQFTRLFNGKNPPLAENMNTFLNENWKDILHELKTPITDGFGKVFIVIINHVLNSFPYAEIFKN
jgi:hypothetical protein